MGNQKLAIIGGSGLYEIAGLENTRWEKIHTPWGAPSDDILSGQLDGLDVMFLPRHGRGHVHDPSTVPYRANIDALKRLGATDVISMSACGSLREDMVPGDFVICDQFIDRTFARPKTFFGTGCVTHVSMAHPTCPRLSEHVADAAEAAGVRVHRGGTHLVMEGPQFSTLAESNMYRKSWGADVIGMTNMPEAKLAREAELCYVSVAMITDFDCWHPDHDAVEVADIVRTLTRNADKARGTILNLPKLLGTGRDICPHGCDRSLDTAMITAPDMRDPVALARLDAVAKRVL